MTPGVWVPFSEALTDRTAGQQKVPRRDYRDEGPLAVIDQGKAEIAGFTNEVDARYKGSLPVILFGDHTRTFKFVSCPFALGADGVKVLEPKPDFEPRFLFYYLLSLDLPDRGYSRHFKFLREVVFPRPDRDVQRRIVGLLDRAESLRALRGEADTKADRILNALFLSHFGDPVTNPKGWATSPVSKLATVTTGNTPSRKRPSFYGDDLEWIKSDNINTPSYLLTRAEEGLSETGTKVARIAPAGSTLVTCIAGSPRVIGNAALANRDVAFNQQINAATPRSDVDPVFLFAHFLVGKPLIQAASTGGMKGLVSKTRFSAVTFLSPPPELQREFGRIGKTLLSLNQTRLRQAARIESLFRAILHRAFRTTRGTEGADVPEEVAL